MSVQLCTLHRRNLFYSIYIVLTGCGLLRTRWLANPLTGLAPLGRPIEKYPNFKRKKIKKLRKKCRKMCRKRIPPSLLGHMGKVWIFKFLQNYTPPEGPTQKKYFEVTHRDLRVAHAKFGRDPSSSLGSKSEQTNKQTERHLSFIYIDLKSLCSFILHVHTQSLLNSLPKNNEYMSVEYKGYIFSSLLYTATPPSSPGSTAPPQISCMLESEELSRLG